MTKNRPLILVVNDDGIHAKGMRILIDSMKSIGETYIIAPHTNRSGSSHSMTLEKEIFIENVKHKEFICSGTPVDCVKLGLNKILPRKPDLCVSGINHGSNHSINGLYSGTLHAAMEGTIHQIPSISFSHLSYDYNVELMRFQMIIQKISQKVIKHRLPEGITLNINFPNVRFDDIKGVKVCIQGDGVWKENFKFMKKSNSKKYYLLSGEFSSNKEDVLTDSWALENNFISLVPVGLNLSSNSSLNEFKYLEYDF